MNLFSLELQLVFLSNIFQLVSCFSYS